MVWHARLELVEKINLRSITLINCAATMIYLEKLQQFKLD